MIMNKFLLVLFLTWAICTGCAPEEPAPVVEPLAPITASLLQQSEEALARENYPVALQLADSASKAQPFAVEPYFLQGLIHTQTLGWEKAEAAYQEVINLQSDYRGVWNNLGNVAMRQSRVRDALGYYFKELEQHPAATPWISIGRGYRELGVIDSAAIAFEKALEMDSLSVDASLAYAQMMEEEGTFEKGIELARKAVRLAPDQPETQYAMGMLLAKTGEDEEAVGYLESVTEAWPWHTESHYSLAQTLQRLGKVEESRDVLARAEKLWQRQAEISYYQKAVSNDPDNPYNYAALGSSFRVAGRYDEALESYRIARTMEPENLELLVNMASLHFLRKDTLAAIRTYEQILQQDKNMVSAWLNLGIMHALQNNAPAAYEAWNQVIEIEPDNQQALEYLSRLEPSTP